MTIKALLENSGLKKIDAELILASLLQKNRAWIMGHDHDTVEKDVQEKFHHCRERKLLGEPTAYILGKKEFYGHEFMVSKAVLIPRPATEILVDATLAFLKNPSDREIQADSGILVCTRVLGKHEPELILDIGTGSGCIAISLALAGVTQRVIGIDSSQDALRIAEVNRKKLAPSASITFECCDGIDAIRKFSKPFIVVSNPPYIAPEAMLEKSVMQFEPHSALFSGDNGLKLTKEIVAAARSNPMALGVLLEGPSEGLSKVLSRR